MGTPWGRGQGQPRRWLRGHWILSRLIFSPPGSLWKSRRGLSSSMLSRWGHVEPEMPSRCPQRGSISTLGNEPLLRAGCKFQAAQTFVVWVSTVRISGDFSENKCKLNGQIHSYVLLSRQFMDHRCTTALIIIAFILKRSLFGSNDLIYFIHSWICP